MNRILVSVFFTVLASTSLGHGHLGSHNARGHHTRSHAIGLHRARSNEGQCTYMCPVPSPSPEHVQYNEDLSLIFIQETDVYAIVNATSGAAIVLQIGEPIALIANGKTGVSIVINIKTQTVIYYPSGSNKNLWKLPQTSCLTYLEKLGKLTNVNKWKNGKTFKFTTVTKQLNIIITSIAKDVSPELAIRVKLNPDSVISLLTVLIKGLLDSREVVELLVDQLRSSVNIIAGGLTKLVNLVVGLKAVGKNLNGGLEVLINNNTDVSFLLGENSGLNSLIDLMSQQVDKVDLSKVLGGLLQSPEAFIGAAVQIDGGIYMGVPGITAVLHNVQLYAAKKISLEALIDVLIQVVSLNGHVKITKEDWNEYLRWFFIVSKAQISKFNTGSSWVTINKFFKDLKEDKLVIEGIDASAIINVLISTSGSNPSLNNIVKILLHLKPVVSTSKAVATLYYRLILFISSGQGLVFIDELLPEIQITISFSSNTNIIKQILSKVNYFKISYYLLRLDIVGALNNLPVLGPILKSLEAAIKAVGVAAEVTVASALKASSSILGELKNLILFGFGRGGSQGSSSGIAGLSSLGGGLKITTSWVSTEKWSSSQGGSSGSVTLPAPPKKSSSFSWSLF